MMDTQCTTFSSPVTYSLFFCVSQLNNPRLLPGPPSEALLWPVREHDRIRYPDIYRGEGKTNGTFSPPFPLLPTSHIFALKKGGNSGGGVTGHTGEVSVYLSYVNDINSSASHYKRGLC